jgi:phage terminase large subunit-like protein
LKDRLDQICLELARRRRDEKIRYFQPNGGQLKFYREIFRPGAFIVNNGSGNGGGKTYGLVAFLAAVCWPNLAPKDLQDPLLQNWPYPKRARIVSTPKELEEIGAIQTAIQDLFPRGQYEALKKGKSYPSQFKTSTGWVIDLMSYEQDKSEMAGPTIGLLMWNEPMPEDLWKEGLARLRKGGLCLIAMTSLLDNPWVVDGIISKGEADGIRSVFCDVEENCKQHGVNGTLEHDQIEKILAQYDPDEREARKTGRPLALSGRIYKAFDRNVHVAKEPIIPPAYGVTHYQAVDPAIGKPVASIWAYVGADGVIHIYDEHPETSFEGARDSNLTVKDYASLWKARENGRQVSRIIDRHFGNVRRTLGGLSLRQEFSQAGLDFRDSYSMDAGVEVETGIMKVKELLRYDASKPIDSLNQPKLAISPTCKNTIASFERWGRNPDTGKPKEEWKDFADCVRYLAMANPVHEVPSSWTPGVQSGYGVNV